MSKFKNGIIGLALLLIVSTGLMFVSQNKETKANETDEIENDKQAFEDVQESTVEEEEKAYVESEVKEQILCMLEPMDIQTPAVEAVDKLSALVDTTTVSPSVIYPEDYAGIYISSENQLVINLTANNDIAKYQALFTDEDPVIFRFVQYSYKELLELAAEISDRFAGIINSVGVDVVENKVSVMVSTADQVDEILTGLNVDDSLALPIEFELGDIVAAAH